MKKKLFALFLALFLLIQTPVCALADVTDTSPGSGEVVVPSETSSEINQPSVSENQEDTTQVTEVVNFEAQLQIDFPYKNDLNEKKGMFLVTLHPKTTDADNNDNEAEGEEVHIDAGKENHYDTVASVEGNVIIFRAANVPAGDYTLKMDAQYYFENFAQDVTIHEGAKTTLVFSNSYASNRGDGKTSPGVFALGDVNNDCVINHDDVVAMLPYMGQTDTKMPDDPGKETEKPDEVYDDTFDAIYDLNLDGKTDIEDLSILAYNMDHTGDHYATPIITVLQSAVKVEKEQAKAVPQGERKLDTIMEDAEEPIQLAPEKDEAISEDNPVEIEMELASTTEIGGMVISAPADNGPAAGTIKVETVNPDDPNGEGVLMEVPITDEQPAPQQKIRRAVRALVDEIASSGATAIRKADGSIEINLGRQVAIKKVTIVVTATAASTNLTEIAKVEFLNDMESRIPEPELNIPGNIQVSGKGDSFTVTWDAETNVTAYEVAVSAVTKDGQKKPEQTYRAGVNRIVISDFKGGVKDKVTPLYTYSIRIKSVNGKWSSPYSEMVEHYQKAGAAPDAPDYVSINGKFRQLDVSWKDMPGTEKYSLEYRVKDSGTAYTVVSDILTNSYKITNLKDDTTYEVRVRGWNTDDKGNLRHGGYSVPAIGKTTNQIPQFAKYKMLQRDEIESITERGPVDYTKYPSDTKFNAEWMIDDDYTTYFNSKSWADIGATVTFTEPKTIKEIVVTNRLEDGYFVNPGGAYKIYITAVKENGERVSIGCSTQSMHPSAKNTARIILNKEVEAKKLEYGVHLYYNAAYSISEINFFEYDSLENDVYNLYADDMHVTLKDTVTQAQIDTLVERANTKDEAWDEYHPKRDLLLSELDYAQELLKNGVDIDAPYLVQQAITSHNTGGSQFNGGLSGYQPLGYVARGGQTLNVYVGQKGKKLGQTVDARLVFTQYHAESASWRSGEIQLKHGKNEITLPENICSLDFERGGSLYVVHTSDNVWRDTIQIRISGATRIPKLNLYRPAGAYRVSWNEADWKKQIRAYIEELIKYNDNLEANHAKHKEQVGGYAYDAHNCFLNSTEISLDNVLISVPASQILKGLGGKDKGVDYLTNKLYNSVVSMNQMIELFYKERGFNPANSNGNNGIPSARFNIRYHRMFAGAFMYAGGNHLGIEWGSVTGLCSGTPVLTDANGKYLSGSMFGWGIAHEMGHNADVGGLTYAEVTNNIWAQFEKTRDTAGSSRIPYPAVYKHVTSNSAGKPGSVFAQLGMYWQLHLAYDKNYAHYDYYKADQTASPETAKQFTNENYQNMLDNEFFARYYQYKRNPGLAPNNGGMTLTNALKGNLSTDQIIMRVSCAAAQKDLTAFFAAWGMVVDATTANYASQFPKEERKLQYISDAAREYTMAGKSAMSSDTVDVTLKQGVKQDARKVTLTISLPDEANMNAVLGYEIIRNGQPVAFVPPATVSADEDGNTVSKYADTTVYTDVVETQNNRVMTYSVVAYDKYLNATSVTELEPIKIRHEGDLPKDNWTVASTNVISEAGVLTVYDGTVPVEGNAYTDVTTNQTVTYNAQMDVRYLDEVTGEVLRTDSAVKRIFDGDKDTYFKGRSSSGNAQLVISLGGKQEAVAIACEPPKTSNVKEWTQLWKYSLEFSADGGNTYTRMSSAIVGNTRLDDGREVLYFRTGSNVKGYSATHVRIITQNNLLAMEELSLLGPSGDNVDIGISTVDEVTGIETWDTNSAIGILENDYVLDANSDSKIPAGSFIVTGKYAGNAAYNVVKLYNQNHKMYDDSFENKRDSIINGYQVFFADMPNLGHITNVKDGTWIYWLEPLTGENEGKFGLPEAGENGADIVVELPTSVYAELYRVDNAMTLAGERLVSDSFVVKVPETLPSITLSSAGTTEN